MIETASTEPQRQSLEKIWSRCCCECMVDKSNAEEIIPRQMLDDESQYLLREVDHFFVYLSGGGPSGRGDSEDLKVPQS